MSTRYPLCEQADLKVYPDGTVCEEQNDWIISTRSYGLIKADDVERYLATLPTSTVPNEPKEQDMELGDLANRQQSASAKVAETELGSLEFNRTDFEIPQFGKNQTAAEQANRILRAKIAALPVVSAHVGPSISNDVNLAVWIRKGWHDADSTHTARLLNITSIAKAKCTKHVAKIESRQCYGTDPKIAPLLGTSVICAVCGVQLEPEWKAKALVESGEG